MALSWQKVKCPGQPVPHGEVPTGMVLCMKGKAHPSHWHTVPAKFRRELKFEDGMSPMRGAE